MVKKTKQAALAEDKAALALATAPAFRANPAAVVSGTRAVQASEIITYARGEFLSPLTSTYTFPLLSSIINNRSDGQGLAFYDTMLGTDADMAGFFRDLVDAVLKFPIYIKAASAAPEHQTHKRFLEFAYRHTPGMQSARRKMLDAYLRGFSVVEKVYEVVTRGEWAGAVVWGQLLDKPARWFNFDLDRNLRFRTSANYLPGELVPEGKCVVSSFGTNSSPWGEAMLDLCYWPWFLRHHAMKNQAIFFEKWATPTAKIEYEHGVDAETSQRNRDEALSVVNAIQADTVVAVPKGMILELIESSRNGTISFESYLDQLRNMLSRIITGQILLGSGEKGGSYALAKVHQEQEGNRVESLAEWHSHRLSREYRELVDRNFGPQDQYPTVEIISRNLAEQQAWLMIEALKVQAGHKVSVSWSDNFLQNVLPEDQSDELVPIPGTVAPQPIAVPPTLSAEDPFAARQQIALAAFAAGRRKAPALPAQHAALHTAARTTAAGVRKHLDALGTSTAREAKPALKKVVAGIARQVRKKKKLKDVTRRHLLKGMKNIDAASMGKVFETIAGKPPAPYGLAAGDPAAPPDVSDTAKLGIALQMYAIVDAVADAADEAPDGMSAADFADSLLDENSVGGSVLTTYGNMFEGTHSTDITSVATAKLRDQLNDPAFRAEYPYVMIVSQPGSRPGHALLDGYIMSSEEARYSHFLPPFDFGCKCVAVPISADAAKEYGLTGGAPTGSVYDYAKARGASPSPYGAPTEFIGPRGERLTLGPAQGFTPPMIGTETYAQLAALRDKANELRAADPDAWAAMHSWLLWLFGYDVLTQDPPAETPDAGQPS